MSYDPDLDPVLIRERIDIAVRELVDECKEARVLPRLYQWARRWAVKADNSIDTARKEMENGAGACRALAEAAWCLQSASLSKGVDREFLLRQAVRALHEARQIGATP